MNKLDVAIVRLEHAKELPLPNYATTGSAGMDLQAAIEHDLILHPTKRALVPTGFKIALPEGFELQIRPRSGLAYKHGITCLNSPGTIDSDYRGELFVLLINLGEKVFIIEPGMRIAQAVIAPVLQASLVVTDELSHSKRGAGGFGSTGR